MDVTEPGHLEINPGHYWFRCGGPCPPLTASGPNSANDHYLPCVPVFPAPIALPDG